MSSSIRTPHATGTAAVVAFFFCVAVNVTHFYLTKTSKRRQTIFGKRLVFWSHGSMLLITLAPVFMIFSYFHPETIFGENVCACQQWFAFAVIAFATGLFLLKINYLVRLNMVLSPGKASHCTTMLGIYYAILIVEMIVINTIQYIVIHGECMPDRKFGCIAGFDEWNGWMATGVLFHDMALYYVFCVYYIRRVKSKLGGKYQFQSRSRAKQVKHTLRKSKDVDDLKMRVDQASFDNSEPTSTRIDSVASKHSVASDTNNGHGDTPPSAETRSSQMALSISEKEIRRRAREMAAQEKEKRKLKLVYKGLIRQFRVTLLAIAVCAFDLLVNTIWMDYNMLWLFMFDSCAVVVLNFLAFRDSQYLIMDMFEWCKNVGCESCSLFIDVCCCMRDTTIDPSNENTITTQNVSHTSTTTNVEKDSTEDSFLRYFGSKYNETNNDENKDIEITAMPQQ